MGPADAELPAGAALGDGRGGRPAEQTGAPAASDALVPPGKTSATHGPGRQGHGRQGARRPHARRWPAALTDGGAHAWAPACLRARSCESLLGGQDADRGSHGPLHPPSRPLLQEV